MKFIIFPTFLSNIKFKWDEIDYTVFGENENIWLYKSK